MYYPSKCISFTDYVFIVAEDIVKLANYLKGKLAECREPTTYGEFRELSLLVLARLISFNRRRPGEVQALR